jgi:tetratricopeptide (TPR) repeat protein
MIIFGWGRQTIKQIGVTFKKLCSHCQNEDYWILTRYMTWFTLFFIPVFPYSIKYFLSCPICKYGLTLDQKQIDQFKPLAEINQLLIDGKITNDEYQMRLKKGTLENSEQKTLDDGLSAFKAGTYKVAEAHFYKLIELDQQNPDYFKLLAQSHSALGKTALAEKCFKKAEELIAQGYYSTKSLEKSEEPQVKPILQESTETSSQDLKKPLPSDISLKYCPYCGVPQTHSGSFCNRCGKTLA